MLSVCLYHTVECQRQREVGEYLAAKGAKIDLVFAAALGRTELVASLIAGDDRVAEALVWAAMNGRDATVGQLLDLGADINGRSPVAGYTITPLHGAAWAGWEGTAALLLRRGADVTLTDPMYGALQWAGRRIAGSRRWSARLRGGLLRAAVAGGQHRRRRLGGGRSGRARDGRERGAPGGVQANPGVLLRCAAWYGQPDIARLLLARGADPALTNPEGKTAHDFARERRNASIAVPAGRSGVVAGAARDRAVKAPWTRPQTSMYLPVQTATASPKLGVSCIDSGHHWSEAGL